MWTLFVSGKLAWLRDEFGTLGIIFLVFVSLFSLVLIII
jgi:hypothetical protein